MQLLCSLCCLCNIFNALLHLPTVAHILSFSMACRVTTFGTNIWTPPFEYSRVAVERSDCRDPKTLAEAPHGKIGLKWHIEKWPPYFWKPLTCGYVAAGVFFFHTNGLHISGSPKLVGTLPQALFFSRKKGPSYFWKPLTCGYVAAGAFFPQKRGPIFLEALNLWVRCRRRLFFPEKWPPYFWKP